MEKQEAVGIIKRKLWSFGYSVKDYSEIEPVGFDLLINDKIKVLVDTSPIEKMPKNCDIFALLGKNKRAVFIKNANGVLVIFKSPYAVFGKPETE